MGLYAPLRTPDDIARLHPSDCANERSLPRRMLRAGDWNGALLNPEQPFSYREMRGPLVAGYIASAVAIAGLAWLIWLIVRG